MKIKDLQNIDRKMKNSKNWYVSYTRKSSESEDRQMASIEDQIKVLKGLVQEKELSILKIYKEAKSAKAPDRPIFNEMISLIHSRNDIKGIICWKLNRLSRNPVDTGTLQWLLQTGKIQEIVTPSKTYTEVDSDFIMAVEGAQANRFIRDLREDTLRGINSKLEKGLAPILAPPGYKNNIEKLQGQKDISSHPTYFTLMRKLFELALTGNFTLQNLVIKADELGIKNSRSKSISKSQMAKVMRNPFYTGRFIYGKKVYKGKHQAMLSDEEFDLLQDILSSRSRPRKQKHDWWHTGIPILCGECGGHITGEYKEKHYKNGKVQILHYARCVKKNKDKKCTQPYIQTKELENQVLEYLSKIKLDQEFMDWAIKWLKIINKNQKEVRDARYISVKKSYENVIRKIDGLLDLKLEGLISNDEFTDKKSTLTEEKARIYDNLIKIDQHIDEWTDLAAKTFDFASTSQERFANGNIEDRKTILKAIGSHLTLKDKKLTIEARTPFHQIELAIGEMNTPKRLAPDKNINNKLLNENLHSKEILWGG